MEAAIIIFVFVAASRAEDNRWTGSGQALAAGIPPGRVQAGMVQRQHLTGTTDFQVGPPDLYECIQARSGFGALVKV